MAFSCTPLWGSISSSATGWRTSEHGMSAGTPSCKTLQKLCVTNVRRKSKILVYGFSQLSPFYLTVIPARTLPAHTICSSQQLGHLLCSPISSHQILAQAGPRACNIPVLSIKFLLISSKPCLSPTQPMKFPFIFWGGTQHMSFGYRLGLFFLLLLLQKSFHLPKLFRERFFLDNKSSTSKHQDFILFIQLDWYLLSSYLSPARHCALWQRF